MIELQPGIEIFVLTGAGVSVASGIQPFRGAGGWWTGNPEAERRATSPDLPRNPEQIWEVYGPIRKIMREAKPNAAHRALARLQRESGCSVRVVTQNVDGLHQAAGCQGVVEFHGSLLRTRCSYCELTPFADPDGEMRPCSLCGHLLRPDVVLFGEDIPETAAQAAFGGVMRCDLFVAVGTSGNVSPASGLVQCAYGYGADTVLVNLEPLDPPNPAFRREILGKAEDVLPRLFSW